MEASEFFKKHGLAEVKILLTSPSHGFFFKEDFYKHYGFDIYEDLKRLVGSHELVELYKNTYGESARWFFIANYCQEHRIAPHQADVYDFVGSKYDSYVADVESCL